MDELFSTSTFAKTSRRLKHASQYKIEPLREALAIVWRHRLVASSRPAAMITRRCALQKIGDRGIDMNVRRNLRSLCVWFRHSRHALSTCRGN
eukprot:1897830-Amphidinium_carterae.1